MGVSQGMNNLTAELKKLRSETTEASVTSGSDDQSHYVNVSKQVSKLTLWMTAVQRITFANIYTTGLLLDEVYKEGPSTRR